MGTVTPRWILCGEATHELAPKESLRLSVITHGTPRTGEFKIALDGIERQMLANIPDIYNDLVEMAAYVYVADQAVSRGASGTGSLSTAWHRSFRFVIPVRRKDFWSNTRVKRQLTTLLAFLSDDSYSFEFVDKTSAMGHQLVLGGGELSIRLRDMSSVRSVILFSGGLDSLTGAYEEVVQDGCDAILVSHSSATKMNPIRRQLVDKICEGSGRRGPLHISVKVERSKEGLDRERTQRSRSFLYAAIAGTVAHLARCKEIRFYENGVIALNIPISPQVLGARATRTAHPKVLEGFSHLLSLIEEDKVNVVNPFASLSRTDVLVKLRDMGGKELFPLTRSCADIYNSSQAKPHCGICSQCIDRRFAAVAANLHDLEPSALYKFDVLNEPLESAASKQLVMGYITSARKWAEVRSDQEFIAKHGEIADALPSLAKSWNVSEDVALERVVEMHRRHGKSVVEAIGNLSKRRAGDWISGRLPADSLLMTVFRQADGLNRELYGITPEFEESAQAAVCVESEPLNRGISASTGVTIVELTRPLDCYMFLKLGESYLVGLKGQKGNLFLDSKALHQVVYLMRHPGELFEPLYLEAAAEGKTIPDMTGEQDKILTFDRTDKKRFSKELSRLHAESAEASNIGDLKRVRMLQSEIERLTPFLEMETRKGRGRLIESKAFSKSLDAVSRGLRRLITAFEEKDARLGDYFKKHLQIGREMGFRDADTDWKLD